MKIFKNGVGRPSNNLRNKRKVISIILVMFLIVIITSGIYFILNINNSKMKASALDEQITSLGVNDLVNITDIKQIYSNTGIKPSDNKNNISYPQGIASIGNDIVILHSWVGINNANVTTNSKNLIRIFDTKTDKLKDNQFFMTAGHGNGATYNNKTGEFIIPSMNCYSEDNTFKINASFSKNDENACLYSYKGTDIINASNNSILSLNNSNELIKVNFYNSAIAYNKDKNVYYLHGKPDQTNNITYIIDGTFSKVIGEFSTKFGQGATYQDMGYYNGYVFYAIHVSQDTKIAKKGDSLIYAYDSNGNFKKLYYIPRKLINTNKSTSCEIEGITFVNGKAYFMFYSNGQERIFKTDMDLSDVTYSGKSLNNNYLTDVTCYSNTTNKPNSSVCNANISESKYWNPNKITNTMNISASYKNTVTKVKIKLPKDLTKFSKIKIYFYPGTDTINLKNMQVGYSVNGSTIKKKKLGILTFKNGTMNYSDKTSITINLKNYNLTGQSNNDEINLYVFHGDQSSVGTVSMKIKSIRLFIK